MPGQINLKRCAFAFSLLLVTSAVSAELMQKPPVDGAGGSSSGFYGDLFWHMSEFDANQFCDASYVRRLKESGEFMTGTSSELYGIIGSGFYDDVVSSEVAAGKYSYFEPRVSVYDPAGRCFGGGNGALLFGAKPDGSWYTGGDWEYSGIEDNTFLYMDYEAVSSEPGRGPFVEAEIHLYYFNQWAYLMGGPSDTFDLALYYLNHAKEWELAKSVPIENYIRESKIFLSSQLPYSTIAQLRLETRYENPTVFAFPYQKDSSFPMVHNVRFWTETCVADLVTGGCL